MVASSCGFFTTKKNSIRALMLGGFKS